MLGDGGTTGSHASPAADELFGFESSPFAVKAGKQEPNDAAINWKSQRHTECGSDVGLAPCGMGWRCGGSAGARGWSDDERAEARAPGWRMARRTGRPVVLGCTTHSLAGTISARSSGLGCGFALGFGGQRELGGCGPVEHKSRHAQQRWGNHVQRFPRRRRCGVHRGTIHGGDGGSTLDADGFGVAEYRSGRGFVGCG